jgi:hypothetical protein
MKSLIDWVIGIFIISILVFFILYASEKPEMTVKYQLITLPGETFDIDVKVLITDDTAFAASYVRANLDSAVTSDMFDCRGLTFGTVDGKSPIIWLPYQSHVAVINHELLHVTIDIMNWAGVPLNESTEEVYAYQLQYLSQQLDNQINITK